ncbi:MAG: acyltransferase [Verrucomicrobiaceae bacterium]|nr:acyltransferase [Verrucomicrobiaceae bacterium]
MWIDQARDPCRKGNGGDLKSLTGLRGVAAAVVFLAHFHFQGLFPSWERALALVEWHNEAVDLFFWLSGFVMTLAYLKNFGVRTPGFWKGYFTARLARVFPVHLLSFSVMLLLFVAGAVVLRKWPAYLDTRTVVSNLLLVQNWPAVNLGSLNIASWSLSVECFCYVVVTPLAFICAVRIDKTWILAAGVLAALAVRVSIPTLTHGYVSLGRGVSGFFGGALLFRLWQSNAGRGAGWWATAGTVWLLVGVAARAWWQVDGRCLMPAFPAIIYGLAVPPAGHRAGLFLSSRPAVWLGDISYSIYMWHIPLGMVPIYHLRPHVVGWSAGGRLTWIVAEMALVLTVSHLSYYRFETPARRRIRARTQSST